MQLNAKKVFSAMVEARIGTKELARKSGLSVGTISRLSRKNARVSVRTLGKLSEALGVPWRSLLVEEETLDF